jgi:hypothetical protein
MKMYANDASYTWKDENNLGMKGSDRNLRKKTALNDAGTQSLFEEYMNDHAGISNGSVENTAETYGNAGVWIHTYVDDGVTKTKEYLMDSNGWEYTQLIEKGLMSAVFMSQMTQTYLANISTDDNVITDTSKTYTDMQHHWDEAYGYFTSEVDFPTNGTDRFWGKYADKREAILGSKTKIATAFRTGRAAININDYTERDAQKEIINMEMMKLCAGTAIYYLKAARGNITNPTLKNHELSEAWAFIYGLQFNPKSSALSSTFTTAINKIKDFENISVQDINDAIDIVASNTGLTSYVEQL